MAKIIGNASDELIVGTYGNDFIAGGFGSDIIAGGKGRDILYGSEPESFIPAHSEGNPHYGYHSDNAPDVFVFNEGDSGVGGANRDVIRGFEPGIDKIDLSNLGYELNFHIQDIGDKALIKIDADHNGSYEMQIAVAFAIASHPFPSFGINDLILA